MGDTTTAAATVQSTELDTPRRIPVTPNSRRRSSSTSSRKDENVPNTPPPKPAHLSESAYHSPDAYTHTHTILPPVTPSSNHTDLSKLGNVPQTPFGVGMTPSSPLKSPSQLKDEEGEMPPIRHLTSKLKTRLNYAFVKYSNGWTNQSIDELEKSVANKEDERLLSPKRQSGLSSSPFSKRSSPSKISKPIKSPIRNHRHSIDLSESNGSAHAAFLNAISKSKSPMKQNGSPRSPFRPPPLMLTTPNLGSSSNNPTRSPEAEAIETLMSLASPQGFKPKLELPRHDLPRQRLSFGENLNNETAVATESDTEYEGTDDERSPIKDKAGFGQLMNEDAQTDSEYDD